MTSRFTPDDPRLTNEEAANLTSLRGVAEIPFAFFNHFAAGSTTDRLNFPYRYQVLALTAVAHIGNLPLPPLVRPLHHPLSPPLSPLLSPL